MRARAAARDGDRRSRPDGGASREGGPRERAGQHRPQGAAPTSAPQAEKNSGPGSRFLRKTRQKFIRVHRSQSFSSASCRAHCSHRLLVASPTRPPPAVDGSTGAKLVPRAVQPCIELARRPDSRSLELARARRAVVTRSPSLQVGAAARQQQAARRGAAAYGVANRRLLKAKTQDCLPGWLMQRRSSVPKL